MALKYTPEELQEHLNYEIKMLVGAWRLHTRRRQYNQYNQYNHVSRAEE